MPWFLPWSESIKKRACRYLLQRYLGQFFEEKLTLDQLSVNLYNGTGTVADVSLDVQALNELGEQQNWPMEFVDGYIEQMSISVPWSSLLKDSSNVEVRGLNITIQPKQRLENVTSMFESMWSSMTSSMQLAQECLKQESPNSADNAPPLEGIERFAQTIDSILSRVKVRFVNTIIRIEHVPKDCNTGVAIQINIQNLEYLDEAGDDPPTSEASELFNQDDKAYVISSFTLKKFILEGVTLSSEEFPSRARTFSRSVTSQSQSSCNLEQSKASEDVFLSTIIEDSIIKKSQDGTRENSVDSTPVNEGPPQFLEISEHEPILFGKLSGRQEIRVRLKQSESICGPKVSMEMTFGSLMLFLSPRQLHVLLELAEGIASPHLQDTSNVASKSRCAEKPMGGLDFQRIEQELQQHLNPVAPLTAGLQHNKGWSTGSYDDDDNDDLDFLPMRNQMMSDSVISSTNSMDSSVSTSISSVSSRGTVHKSRRNSEKISCVDVDPTAEITHFQIRLASLAVVLLHEDLLTLSTSPEPSLVMSSIAQMKHTANTFFDNLGMFGIMGYGNKDFENVREIFDKSCQLNHIRLLCAPIQIEGDQKSTLTAHALNLSVAIAKLELLECLWNGQEPVEYVQLLSEIEDPQSRIIGISPFLRVEYKHIERIPKHPHQKSSCSNKTDIQFFLNKCITEVDITIVDRICAVLNPQPVCSGKNTPKNSDNATGPFTQATQPDLTTSEYKYDIKVSAPVFTIKLRFPIPDFRQPHDMQRLPWWKRNVRADYLTLQMTDASVISNLTSQQSCVKFEIICRLADLHYTDESGGTTLHIGRISVDDKCGTSLPGFNWPRMVMEIYPLLRCPVNLEDHSSGLEIDELSSMKHSMDGFGEIRDDNINSKNPNPFSSKKVVHESDTPHTRQQSSEGATEELIIPGDRQEMINFIEHSTRSSRLRLELFVPTLSVQLVSKHIYELLYNRINSDLLLWEPSAPRPQQNFINATNLECDLQESIYPMFSMCKSGIQYDSETDSEEESGGENEGVFYSICETKFKKQIDISSVLGQSFLSLNIHVSQGVLCMNPPVRDTSLNVIPEQQGELLLILEDASIFMVSQYMGNSDLSYVCVQSVSASLHHSDITATPSQIPPLKEIGCTLPRHLITTIYKSEPGVAVQSAGIDRCGQRDMLSVAIRIQASHETHHMKTIRVAVGVRLATLRHRMCAEPNSWFTQMIDFFDVLDYPIAGYNPMAVLTEFHLHLWDCAIDYRPCNLPIRSLLALGNFSMSSHLAAQVNTSTLRFIAEECYLFLSDKGPPKGRVPSIAPVDLRRDYVCVVELSLFELSLRLSDHQRGVPHVDLRASNNIVHVRTCSDTARSLMQLITYFATDGDLTQKDSSTISSEQSTPRKQLSEQLLNVEPQEISDLSTSQHLQVNELLGEAMRESLVAPVPTEINIEGDPNGGTDVFYFPDESTPLPEIVPITQLLERQISHKNSDTDEEFYFVGDEAGLGIMPKSGLPEIRWLTDEPVRIIDNHFTVPVGKTDLLKPPKHFPPAVLKYTLCEMTLVWHLYGGYDFQSSVKEKEMMKKTVNFSEDQAKIRGSEVSFTKNNSDRVVFTAPKEKKDTGLYDWRVRGGNKRDHDTLMELQLNKVKFTHEVYPEDTIQASRQVLLVSEVEVRDRLASSHFNKFLYQHTSQARPKQSHANMIVIKATHIRPDPKLSAQECILRVAILPLRLNVDQDSLLFLVKFFNELGGQDVDCSMEGESTSRHTTPTHQPPVMTVTMENTEEVKQQAQKLVSDNLLILLEEDESSESDSTLDKQKSKNVPQLGEEIPPPIYFRNVLFSPDVPIRLDYQGKHVDMTHGPLAGLLMGLGQLNCSELRLKRLSHRHGLLGIDKLLSYCLHEWLQDIKRHQLPSLLGGFGPMHSFVQLFQGIRDLFWLPIEQYQKDGRLVRGLQRGANSFTTSTAMAALELTSRIIHLIQATAETAYDMVSPGPSVRRRSNKGKKGRRRHYSQPQDIREGMANAYQVVKEGIGETAGTIVRVASQEHEQKGYSGAVGGVLRQIPPTFVKPIIIASEATNNVLGGMRSQLVPDARREASQKWRSEDG